MPSEWKRITILRSLSYPKLQINNHVIKDYELDTVATKLVF